MFCFSTVKCIPTIFGLSFDDMVCVKQNTMKREYRHEPKRPLDPTVETTSGAIHRHHRHAMYEIADANV